MSFKLDIDNFSKAIVELIRQASTQLPSDVVNAMQNAIKKEKDGSPAKSVLQYMLKNANIANENSTPICQDTGTNIYFITIPEGISLRAVQSAIIKATREATKRTYLRPNAVDSITGKNSGDNTGKMAPYFHFEEWDEPVIKVELMLKGGGCENVSDQYKLPNSKLNAGRNLEGVYKCIIDAINNAQGLGCAPGVAGIGIGGDRVSGMVIAKKQLFRKLNDTNPNQELNELEKRLFTDLNTLGIGPMGFGGRTTVLGVKIGAAHRLPASFFVSLAYSCWADRRCSMQYTEDKISYA